MGHGLSHSIPLPIRAPPLAVGSQPSLMQAHGKRLCLRMLARIWLILNVVVSLSSLKPSIIQFFFSPSGILNGATQHSVFLEGRKWCWCCCGEGLQRGWDISQAEGRTWSMAGICRLITPLGDFRSNFRGAESGILWSTTISQSLFFHMFFPLHRS